MSPAECDRLWASLEALRVRVERLTWTVIALAALVGGGSAEAIVKAVSGL